MPSTINVDGLSIRYLANSLAMEPGKTDKGIIVVLFHGNAFSLDNWVSIETLKILEKDHFAAYAVDLPAGKGSKSSKVEKKGVEEYAPILKDIFAKLGIEASTQLVLVGPSMGGSFALAYALAYPNSISGLVLISPSLRSLDESGLSSIKIPVLLLWGEKDNVFPLEEYGRNLKERFEKAKLLIIKGAGHAAYLDKPDEFHELLIDFLNELS